MKAVGAPARNRNLMFARLRQNFGPRVHGASSPSSCGGFLPIGTAMTLQQGRPRTKGASHFEPDIIFDSWNKGQKYLPEDDDLRSSIIATFNLPYNDSYVYHAIASVTLSQVQEAINHGGKAGLHAWYMDDEGKPVRRSHQYRECLGGLTI